MNRQCETKAFSYDLVKGRGRLAAIFHPYPSITSSDESGFGKPIYVEALEGDEPYPFLRRSDLLGRNWWDLRYLSAEDDTVIAPTIIGREFAEAKLGFSHDESPVIRHLLRYPISARIEVRDPFREMKRLLLKDEGEINACVQALGLSDLSLGVTGSLLIDEDLSVKGRDLDLVVSADHETLWQIARLVRTRFLNTTYKHVWPLRAVLEGGLEVDLFFTPASDTVSITKSFRAGGAHLEHFSGIVTDDDFTIYAPTILRCSDFACVVLGTAVRGEYTVGDRIAGAGVPGRIRVKDTWVNAFLVEDSVSHLDDAPRSRVRAATGE